jgi:hypothetical protein
MWRLVRLGREARAPALHCTRCGCGRATPVGLPPIACWPQRCSREVLRLGRASGRTAPRSRARGRRALGARSARAGRRDRGRAPGCRARRGRAGGMSPERPGCGLNQLQFIV